MLLMLYPDIIYFNLFSLRDLGLGVMMAFFVTSLLALILKALFIVFDDIFDPTRISFRVVLVLWPSWSFGG